MTNPKGFSADEENHGAVDRSWLSGKATDASGNPVGSSGGGRSRGTDGSEGDGASNANDDGNKTNIHDKKMTDQIIVQHATETVDSGASVDLSISGKKYNITVKPVPPPDVGQFQG